MNSQECTKCRSVTLLLVRTSGCKCKASMDTRDGHSSQRTWLGSAFGTGQRLDGWSLRRSRSHRVSGRAQSLLHGLCCSQDSAQCVSCGLWSWHLSGASPWGHSKICGCRRTAVHPRWLVLCAAQRCHHCVSLRGRVPRHWRDVHVQLYMSIPQSGSTDSDLLSQIGSIPLTVNE